MKSGLQNTKKINLLETRTCNIIIGGDDENWVWKNRKQINTTAF
jgi:hypothetical protein